MGARTKVVDVELSQPVETISGLSGYGAVRLLVRLHGTPLGYTSVRVERGHCSAAVLRRAIFEEHGAGILRHLLSDSIGAKVGGAPSIADLVDACHPNWGGSYPFVTVAVCTRDRIRQLGRCLNALQEVDYPALELLVVDNAPSGEGTERLVRERFRDVRYVREVRPGLNWARNRAILEARGEIIAYTDDDVVVDAGWLKALAAVFVEDAHVMAVTGLVVPYELETDAQLLFERNGGFGRGFDRAWYRVDNERGGRVTGELGDAGRFGTGANMAYRRSVFQEIGCFDPALDAGTVTEGGGDLEMFFRILKEGHALVYEPRALVRHQHRRELGQLRRQLRGNGAGFFSYIIRSALAYPNERLLLMRLGLWWVFGWNVRRLLASFLSPTPFPRDLILAELRGAFEGLTRYRKATRISAEIVRMHGASQVAEFEPRLRRAANAPAQCLGAVAVRSVDVARPIRPLADVSGYSSTELCVTWKERVLGRVAISNKGLPISVSRIRDSIVEQLGLKLVEPWKAVGVEIMRARAFRALYARYVEGDGSAIGAGKSSTAGALSRAQS